MADPYVPIFRAATADSTGTFLSWTAVGRMGALYIRNAGPNEVFFAFDALPTASVGDGRWRLQVNEAVNLDQVTFTTIGLRCAALQTGVVEAIGIPRQGGGGQGVA